MILGPSGSGKSTLLNMLGGLDSLDDGVLTIGGVTVSKLTDKELVEYRRADVGFVFQFYNLIPDLTVKENIQVAADIAKEPLDIEEVMEQWIWQNIRILFRQSFPVVSSSVPV